MSRTYDTWRRLATATLLAVCLLMAVTILPTQAQTSPAAGLEWREITLQHIPPSDILKLMHWDTSGSNAAALSLPYGVAHIVAPPSGNSLMVEANDVGFIQVKNIVHILDVVPRPVLVKIIFVAMPEAQANSLLPAILPQGEAADKLLEKLRQAKATVFPPSIITTPNNGYAIITGNAPPGLPPLCLTPYVNSDNSIRLNIGPQTIDTSQTSASKPPTFTLRGTPPQTVHSGETALYVPRFAEASGDKILLFVTPTLLPATNAALPFQRPPDPVGMRWYAFPVLHNDAGKIVQMMHWQEVAGLSSTLPDGVEQVVPVQDENILIVQATPDGYNEVRKIVKILDVAADAFLPRMTSFSVLANESELHYGDPPTAELEAAGNDAVTAEFQRLTNAGHTAVPVNALNGFENAPQSWNVDGFSIALGRFNSDDSLMLSFRSPNSRSAYVETQRVQRGGVLAVRQKGQPQITFLKVDY